MKKQDIQKLYKKQKKLLLKYNHHYFNLDSPLVSDSKYDKVKNEVIELENSFTYLKDNKSIFYFSKNFLTNERNISNQSFKRSFRVKVFRVRS